MRYLGNKVRLLTHIAEGARRLGFERGTVCDLFAGTSVVGSYFRSQGNRVLATDLMNSSYVFQKVQLELTGPPPFERLRREVDLPRVDHADASWQPALGVFRHLEEGIDPAEGLLTRQYSPGCGGERRYLRAENARRLDAMLGELREWRQRQWIDEGELCLLLASIIDATDRVANISGTYGAFLKEWQANALQEVKLRPPELIEGPRGEANHADAFHWLPEVEADLLYLDPPYNHRQYPANYHLMEVIARFPAEADLSAFEGSIYGKTGLLPWREKRSVLCSQAGSRCADAFRELLRSTRIPRVLISYSEEGIVSREQFREMLAEFAGRPPFRLGSWITEISYRRFRSDQDGRVSRTGASRQYRQVPERESDEVHEWLLHVRRDSS